MILLQPVFLLQQKHKQITINATMTIAPPITEETDTAIITLLFVSGSEIKGKQC